MDGEAAMSCACKHDVDCGLVYDLDLEQRRLERIRILASAQLGLENGPPQRTDVETLWQILNIIVKAPGWEVVCAECKRHPPTQWWPNGDWLCGICYELRCGPEPPR